MPSTETRTTLISAAAKANLLDASGRPDTSRTLALIADGRLKQSISERSQRKLSAGINSAPKGLAIQINKRIMLALGLSVTDNKKNEELQEVVALIRSRCERKIREENIDYFSTDWEQQDKAAKTEIYTIIDRMVATYKSGQ